MNCSLLSRLHTNGVSYLISGILLLIGIPLYQVVVLNPAGLDDVLNGTRTGGFTAYLTWISQHSFQFIIYRVLLILAFALLLTLPFSLYRIIVAQEIMGQHEPAEEEEQIEDTNGLETVQENNQRTEQGETNGMPLYAWRGKGFLVLAAWAGIIGLVIYVLGTIASTLYFVFFVTSNVDSSTVTSLVSIFAISTNTIGIGLLGLSILFFGAMICRAGLNLWPAHWVVFSYAAILVGGLLCISAIGVASTPGVGQNTITTTATLLSALWVCSFGLMLIRLRPEA